MANVRDAMAAAIAAKVPTEVPFRGYTYRVAPPNKWRNSAFDGIAASRMNQWARAVMNDEDAAHFVAADFTADDNNEFFAAYTEAAGQAPGESQPS